MFTFLHAADLHLDSPLRGLERYPGAPVDEIRGATRRALQNMVALAVRERVAFVLIAGDIFDGDWRDYNTGDFFRRQMGVLHDHAIPVITIRGNHDAQSQITRSLRLPPNVRDLDCDEPETFRLDDLGVAIHGQGFARRDVMENLSARYPRPDRGSFNVGLLHTCAEGQLNPDGHAPYAPCTLPGLKSREYEYWALGHIHQRRLLCDDPPILFPGNIQGRSVRECGPRGCSLVQVRDGRAATPLHVDLDIARWRQEVLDVSRCVTLEDVLDAAQAQIAASVSQDGERISAVRLSLTGASAAHGLLDRDSERLVVELRTAMESATGGRAWLEKVEVSTRTPVDLDTLAETDAALGELVRLIRSLDADADACQALAADFRSLKHQLPLEAQTLEEGLDVDDGRAVASLLGDVEQLLVSRLVDSGSAH